MATTTSTTTTATTTTATTTTSTRTGTQLNVGTSTTSYDLGTYVTDVALQPYIASTIVSFSATGMRPNITLHVFFDGVLMDKAAAPGVIDPTYPVTDYKHVKATGTWGTPVRTDAQGTVAGQLLIPPSMFRIGERTLELADITNLALGSDAATTVASATYVAQNLSVTRQGTTLSTINPVLSYSQTAQSISNTQLTTSVVSNTVVVTTPDQVVVPYNPPSPPQVPTPVPIPSVPDVPPLPGGLEPGTIVYDVFRPWDPIAQEFFIQLPDSISGCFLTSIDLFFHQKSNDSQHGVTFFVCETTNGYPDTSKILPYSTVHLPRTSINADSFDGDDATRFTFPAPVFVNNGDIYAFVVRPDANDPDYRIWTARLGDNDISTGKQMYTMPVAGTLFVSQNQKAWSAVQDEYIKFNMNRANFTAAQGQAFFNNNNDEFLRLGSLTYANSTVSILTGDAIFQSVNSTPSTVNTSIFTFVDLYEYQHNIIRGSFSTGLFTSNSNFQVHRLMTAGATPNANTLIAYGTISDLPYVRANALAPQFSEIVPTGTSLSHSYYGVANNYAYAGDWITVDNGATKELYDFERIISGRSKEVASLGGYKSLLAPVSFVSGTSYLSPVVDTVGAAFLVIANNIDPSFKIYDEQYNYGVVKTKYISKPITLSPGQDSEDLQVIITAHRPAVSDIFVLAKFLNAHDPDSITNKTWSYLYNTGYDNYTSNDPNDQKEYTFRLANSIPTVLQSGLVTVSGNVVTGTGTAFSNTLITQYIKVGEDTRQVSTVTNATSLTVSNNFSIAWTANNIYSSYLPTHAYISMADEIELTGTVDTVAGNNILTGTSTLFTTEIKTGTVLVIGDDSLRVSSVANDTYATMEQPFTATLTGANGFIEIDNGLTYSDNTGAMYNTYITFQIKVIMVSKDTSKVPTLDDIRSIALLT